MILNDLWISRNQVFSKNLVSGTVKIYNSLRMPIKSVKFVNLRREVSGVFSELRLLLQPSNYDWIAKYHNHKYD